MLVRLFFHEEITSFLLTCNYIKNQFQAQYSISSKNSFSFYNADNIQLIGTTTSAVATCCAIKVMFVIFFFKATLENYYQNAEKGIWIICPCNVVIMSFCFEDDGKYLQLISLKLFMIAGMRTRHQVSRTIQNSTYLKTEMYVVHATIVRKQIRSKIKAA